MRRNLVVGATVSLAASLVLGQTLSRAIDLDPTFEAYAPCQKLEVIESDGKSVAGYLYDSGYEEFETAISTACTEYADELEEAKELILASGPVELCGGLDIDASQYLEKATFRELAFYIYEVCPGQLTQLADTWQTIQAQDPDLAFDILHPCDKLERKEGLGELNAGWIVESGIEDFDYDILQFCPDHLGILAAALDVSDDQGSDRNSNDGGGAPNGDSAIGPLNPAFENLPKCEKLRIVDGDPDKNLVDYISASGVEDFEFDVEFTCPQFQEAINAAR